MLENIYITIDIWKQFQILIRPFYWQVVPTRQVLGGTIPLDRIYIAVEEADRIGCEYEVDDLFPTDIDWHPPLVVVYRRQVTTYRFKWLCLVIDVPIYKQRPAGYYYPVDYDLRRQIVEDHAN